MRSKKILFFDFLIKYQVSIAFVSETFLDESDSFSGIGFRTIRLDRGGQHRGGGVAIVMRKELRFRQLPCPRVEVVEALSVEVLTATGPLTVTAIYFPGSSDPLTLEGFKRDMRLLTSSFPNHIIAGDLNARHRFWGCAKANRAGTMLYDEMSRGQFELYFPDEPTHFPESGATPSTIDLVLRCGNHPVSDVRTVCELTSDHKPVLFSTSSDLEETTAANFIRDYDMADWQVFSNLIKEKISTRLANISTEADIDSSIDLLTQAIREAEDVAVPKKEVRLGKLTLPLHIRRLQGSRNALNRRWQRETDFQTKMYLKSARDELTESIQSEITKLTNKRFADAVEKIDEDPGPFRRKYWKLIRYLKTKPRGIPVLEVDGVKLATNAEKGNAFANHFEGIHNSAAETRPNRLSRTVEATRRVVQDTNLHSCHIPLLRNIDVEREVKLLKNNKAPGPDAISNRSLKHLPDEGYTLFRDIMNACLRLGYFPKLWKSAHVITICKPKKPAKEVKSYRPISLLSSLGKLFERLLLPRFQQHIQERQIILNHQFGFRPGRSCTQQLFRVTGLIRKAIKARKSAGMLSLDLQSAFDTVWHSGLVYKLQQLEFPPYLVKLTSSFLSDRKFQVRIGKSLSEQRPVLAGVPQGAVLSPTLFNIYVADMPVPEQVELAQFADDTATIAVSHSTSAVTNKLQRAANKISKYFSKWRVKINGSKSEAVLFTRKTAPRHRPQRKLEVAGQQIEWKSSLKYLGMHLDKRLTFGKHVDEVLMKGQRVLKALYSLVCRRSRLSLTNKILLFKTVFRPTLTYACPVWAGCAKTHLQKMQRFQNRILKFMLDVPWWTRTLEVHESAEIELLENFLQRQLGSFHSRCETSFDEEIAQLFSDFSV